MIVPFDAVSEKWLDAIRHELVLAIWPDARGLSVVDTEALRRAEEKLRRLRVYLETADAMPAVRPLAVGTLPDLDAL